MQEQISAYLQQFPWLDETIQILLYFASAWLIAFLLKRFVHRAVRFGRLAPLGRAPSPERQQTLKSLLSGAINLIAYVTAILSSVGLFVKPDTLVWMVGLFSAAFGLGARPLISDYLAGISFIFEDTFSVGEKIELPGLNQVDGVIEKINLRTTSVRAPSGELYVVPNGEIRVVRNFSRGKFSVAKITLRIAASDLGNTMNILESLGEEAVVLLPNLIEPWQVISPEGMIGQYTELTLVAKARFGQAADMRPRLLKLVQERLAEGGIILAA